MAIERLQFFDLEKFKADLSARLADGNEVRFGDKSDKPNLFFFPLLVCGADDYDDKIIKAQGYLKVLQEENEETGRMYERVEVGNYGPWEFKEGWWLPKAKVILSRYETEEGMGKSRVDFVKTRLLGWQETNLKKYIPDELFPTPC